MWYPDNTCFREKRVSSLPAACVKRPSSPAGCKPIGPTFNLSLVIYFISFGERDHLLDSWMKGKYLIGAGLSLAFVSAYVLLYSCLLLDIVFNPLSPQKVSPFNQYIHKEPQTLMAIIMFISSTLRCGYNISFRGTSLNSCKLFPSGSLKGKHQVQLSQ